MIIMKKTHSKFKRHIQICSCVFSTLFIAGCTNPGSPPVTPTFEYIAIESTNANTPAGDCNIWNLNIEPPGMSLPTFKRTDTFNGALTTHVTVHQSSAYNKLNQIYLVSTDERVVRYDLSTTIPAAPTVFTISNIQAMEFVGTRLFMIVNNYLKEFDPVSMTQLSSFTPRHVGSVNYTGYISNMTSKSGVLYFIVGGSLLSYDTNITASTLLVLNSNLPVNASGTFKYDGLEVIDGNTFFVVKRDTTNDLLKVTSTTSTMVLANVTGNNPTYDRLSSAYDYTTEFYYINTYLPSTNQTSIIGVDVTPASSVFTSSIATVNNYIFGLQLKD